jgi:hypothetical protein
VLIQTLAIGVCGTDREIVEGMYGQAPEGADWLILGHESLGRVLEAPADSGLTPGEGAFLACTFWLADNLALLGRHRQARDLFERLLRLCNDVGLLSEEYDPGARRLVGNFPQAFSHIGLVNTADNLSRRAGPAAERLRT